MVSELPIFERPSSERAPEGLADLTAHLYAQYGQSKEMGESASDSNLPHFFLLRKFLGENDLLTILNTKRCRYRCHFCNLPDKSSATPVEADSIKAQFRFVIKENKHSLSILDRVTLSNEGSVLDATTLPREALLDIVAAVGRLKRVKTLVLESRLEFVDADEIRQIALLAPRAGVDILTGFETVSPELRDNVLKKREPLELFLSGLDQVGEAGAHLTAYVLFKPSPEMSDSDAISEANESIAYLTAECARRRIPLTVRLNPMYLSEGTAWKKRALECAQYQPPRLTDALRVARSWSERG